MTTQTDYEMIISKAGISHTPETFIAFINKHVNNQEFSAPFNKATNNLTMRQQISSYGYNRISRKFADKVIELYSI